MKILIVYLKKHIVLLADLRSKIEHRILNNQSCLLKLARVSALVSDRRPVYFFNGGLLILRIFHNIRNFGRVNWTIRVCLIVLDERGRAEHNGLGSFTDCRGQLDRSADNTSLTGFHFDELRPLTFKGRVGTKLRIGFALVLT